MEHVAFGGRSILIVEEEPRVILELEEGFRLAGARVVAAARLPEALHLAEHPALSAAVLNLRLGSDHTSAVCQRLQHLGIPFMFYTRYDPTEASHKWPSAPVMSKPADSRAVVRAVAGLLH
jgi:DNA-binding response OmpR family regulator